MVGVLAGRAMVFTDRKMAEVLSRRRGLVPADHLGVGTPTLQFSSEFLPSEFSYIKIDLLSMCFNSRQL